VLPRPNKKYLVPWNISIRSAPAASPGVVVGGMGGHPAGGIGGTAYSMIGLVVGPKRATIKGPHGGIYSPPSPR